MLVLQVISSEPIGATSFQGVAPDAFVRGVTPLFEPFDTQSVVDIEMKDTDNNERVDLVSAAIAGDDSTIKYFDNRLDTFGLFQFETDSPVGGASIG